MANAILRSYSDAPFRAHIAASDLGGVILSEYQRGQLVEIVNIVANSLSARLKVELADKEWPEFINLDHIVGDHIHIALNYS